MSYDKKISILDIETREVVQKFQTHLKPIKFSFLMKKEKIFITYSEETFLNIFNLDKKSPILTLKTLGNSNLKSLGMAKISKHHYFIFLQYTEIIQMWILEISLAFSQSKILDSFQIRSKSKENINKAFLQKYDELILCVGHHSDLKFITLNNFIGKNSTKIIKSALEKELSKLDCLISEPVTKKDNKKTSLSANQINEEHTYVLGDLDIMKEKINNKTYDNLSHLLKEQNDFKEKTSIDSLSLHLTQSILSNDQEMIDFCLKNSDKSLIHNTLSNLKTEFLSPLLDILVAKIINFPNRSKNLIKWLKVLLKTNTSYFIGCVDIKEKFGNLSSVLLNKTRNLRKLSDLKSKIDCFKKNNFEKNGLGGKSQKKLKSEQLYKPIILIEEGEMEKVEEIIQEQKEEKQEFLNVSFSDKDSIDVDGEFDKALKAHDYEKFEKEQEDFIDLE